MKKVIISPYSRKLRYGGGENPKNYPYWKDVTKELTSLGVQTIHVTEHKDEDIGASVKYTGLSLDKLKSLLDVCDAWISVDNFFQHFATYHNKPGVVIFSQSDPLIYGYSVNVNLLKDRRYLRPDQFCWWEQAKYNIDAYIEPHAVSMAVIKILKDVLCSETD